MRYYWISDVFQQVPPTWERTQRDHHEWVRLAADALVLGGSHLWQATVASGWTLLAAGHDGCPSVLVKIVGKLVQEATRQAVTGVTRLSS